MAIKPQTSVRYNPDKLNLIKTRESLETVQQVVDYLVDAYWWQHKLNPRTKDGAPATEFQAFEEQIKEANEVPALELVKWAVIKSASLDQMEKKVLMTSAGEKIRKLQNK
jgi:hypothetical protein